MNNHGINVWWVYRRKKTKIRSIRGIAVDLEITAAYLSDIEKGRRNPPDIGMLEFLYPSIFGNRFYVFRNKYFDMVGYGNHTL